MNAYKYFATLYDLLYFIVGVYLNDSFFDVRFGMRYEQLSSLRVTVKSSIMQHECNKLLFKCCDYV